MLKVDFKKDRAKIYQDFFPQEAEIAHILECNPITILDKTEMRLHTEGLLDKKIISCMDVAAAIFTKQKEKLG